MTPVKFCIDTDSQCFVSCHARENVKNKPVRSANSVYKTSSVPLIDTGDCSPTAIEEKSVTFILLLLKRMIIKTIPVL